MPGGRYSGPGVDVGGFGGRYSRSYGFFYYIVNNYKVILWELTSLTVTPVVGGGGGLGTIPGFPGGL